MRITKFGHSCLLVEEGKARILLDPGKWSEGHSEVKDIDAILITHEHPDHAHPESLKKILENNPDVIIYTNEGAGDVLEKEEIRYERVQHGSSFQVRGVTVEVFGRDHAVIYSSFPIVRNTGYLIAGRLFHPGDALRVPEKAVEILALPVVAPWMRLAECIDYAKQVKPKICFPIHDGMLKHTGPFHMLPAKLLETAGIEVKILEPGVTVEF